MLIHIEIGKIDIGMLFELLFIVYLVNVSQSQQDGIRNVNELFDCLFNYVSKWSSQFEFIVNNNEFEHE